MAKYSSDAASILLNVPRDRVNELIKKYIDGAELVDGEYVVDDVQLKMLSEKMDLEKREKKLYGFDVYSDQEDKIIIDNEEIVGLHREIMSHQRSMDALAGKLDRLSERLNEQEQESNGKGARIRRLVRSHYPETVGVEYDVFDDEDNDVLVLTIKDISITKNEFGRELNALMKKAVASGIIPRGAMIGPFRGGSDEDED